jgi:hypothetical protein
MGAIVRTVTGASFVFALTLGLAGAGAAQDRPAPNTPSPDVSYEFGDHEVDGGRYSPDGSVIESRGRLRRSTLVRPRVHFVPELVRSVERL